MNLSQESSKTFLENSNIHQIHLDFNLLQEKTRSGTQGKTAKFYQQYIDVVKIYKQFSRTYISNKFEIYTYALEKKASFFSGKRLNYAGWMTRVLIQVDMDGAWKVTGIAYIGMMVQHYLKIWKLPQKRKQSQQTQKLRKGTYVLMFSSSDRSCGEDNQ